MTPETQEQLISLSHHRRQVGWISTCNFVKKLKIKNERCKYFSNTSGNILWNSWDICSGYILNNFSLVLKS